MNFRVIAREIERQGKRDSLGHLYKVAMVSAESGGNQQPAFSRSFTCKIWDIHQGLNGLKVVGVLAIHLNDGPLSYNFYKICR